MSVKKLIVTDASSPATWTAPTLLIGTAVQFSVAGGVGDGLSAFPAKEFEGHIVSSGFVNGIGNTTDDTENGSGAIVSGSIPVIPGSTTLTLNTKFGLGGTAGTSTFAGLVLARPGSQAGDGGNAAAISEGSTILVVGGGGGGLGATSFSLTSNNYDGGPASGSGGDPNAYPQISGGAAPPSGTGGTLTNNGSGSPGWEGPGAGVGHDGGPGENAPGGIDFIFGGGGGGGGWKGGGGGGGGPAGADAGAIPGGGGSSFVDPTVIDVVMLLANLGPAQIQLSWSEIDAPFAPLLTSPANAGFDDPFNAEMDFEGIYQPGVDSGALVAAALRVNIAGTYQYWNGTAFVGTVQWVPTTADAEGNFGLTIPAGLLADGASYSWSLAAQEGAAELTGPFAKDNVFTAVQGPTVVALNPSGNVPNLAPSASWEATFPAGQTQTAYRVLVYTAAQVAAPGFAAGLGSPVFDSMTQASTATIVPLTVLMNATDYVVFLQLTQTNGAQSGFFSSAFDITVPKPNTPDFVGIPGIDPLTQMPVAVLSLTENDNLLSLDDSSFLTGIGSWVGTGCTLVPIVTGDGETAMLITAN